MDSPLHRFSTSVSLSQVRGKEGQKEQSQKTFITVSRRTLATQLAIASLAATSTILPEPAEARISNPEIQRKFFEKLKLLREKLGLSKPDTENEEKTSSPEAVEKEKPLPQLPLSPLPVQTAEALVVLQIIADPFKCLPMYFS